MLFRTIIKMTYMESKMIPWKARGKIRESKADKKERRVWKVTTSAIADACGCTNRTVRDAIQAGLLDPADLVQLSEYVMSAALWRKFATDRKKRKKPVEKTVHIIQHTRANAKTDTSYDYGDSQERPACQSPLDKPIDPNFKWDAS